MKIGIFGGSFNPIHIGHAILANYISQNAGLDQLWLMVTPQNPLKEDSDHRYDAHRIRMVQMVASRCENVSTSGFEFTMPQPNYTINTLDALAKKFPDDHFVIIIGGDNWAVFDKWKDYQRIIDEYGVIVYPRRGYTNNVPDEYKEKVKMIDAPLIEISSSYIREQLHEMRNMNFYLPQDVYRYILENHLYY